MHNVKKNKPVLNVNIFLLRIKYRFQMFIDLEVKKFTYVIKFLVFHPCVYDFKIKVMENRMLYLYIWITYICHNICNLVYTSLQV